MRERSVRRPGVALVSVALVSAALALAVMPASAATADDYPSWSDVQAAKHSAAQKAAEVRRIQALLVGLQQQAAAAGEAAVQAQAAAAAADGALAGAAAKAAALQRQVAAATAKATTSRRQAVVVATQLMRAGDPTLSVWLSGGHSATLLYRLGTLQQLGGSSTAMLAGAVADERDAQALGAQADAAKRERDHLAVVAHRLEAKAVQAEQAADAAVASNKAHTATLQSQLTALNAHAAQELSQYDQGVAAKAAAAAAGSGGGDGSLGGGGGPGSLSPDGARSYAAGRIGAYGWGSGDDDCLGWLWYRESGWRWDAYNVSSGAYGIPQSLPADKLASAGADWRTSSSTQIDWGLGYIQARYGSPCNAWAHETSYGWY